MIQRGNQEISNPGKLLKFMPKKYWSRVLPYCTTDSPGALARTFKDLRDPQKEQQGMSSSPPLSTVDTTLSANNLTIHGAWLGLESGAGLRNHFGLQSQFLNPGIP